MVSSGQDGGNNTHPETTNEERTSAESVVEKSDNSEATEQEEFEDVDDLYNDTIGTESTVTGVATLGAAGLTTESARRIGIDRHSEAGFADRAYAQAYANEIDGTSLKMEHPCLHPTVASTRV